MNLKTTIALLFLAAGCVALFIWGPDLAPKLGLAPAPVQTTDAGTFKTLADLPVEKVVKIDIAVPDQPKLEFKAPAAAPAKLPDDAEQKLEAIAARFELPGNWPIRRFEVVELLKTLRDLKSRYHPIAIDANTDLKLYGLTDAQKPIVVEIATTDGTVQKLKFGEAPLEPGQNPFTRATYVRLEGKNEVLRLGPQVLPVLLRNEENYRRRQLFPEAIRARIAEPKRPPMFPGMEEPPATSASTFLLSDAAVKIAVETPGGRFVLQRIAPLPTAEAPADKPDGEVALQPAKLADSWIIVEPVRDRIDPDKVRGLLTAIPSLWLEKFVDMPQAPDAFYGLGAHTDVAPKLFTLLGGSIPNGTGDSIWRAVMNYDVLSEAKSPGAKLTVTLQDGSSRTLQIGRVSRAAAGDEFRYAKIENNPFVFELKIDRLSDLQINLPRSTGSPLDDLRDPLLVRFDADRVVGIEISSKGEKIDRSIKLDKSGSDWKLVRPIFDTADRTEATELVNAIKGFEARKGSIFDGKFELPAFIVGGPAAIDLIAFFGLTPDKRKTVTLTFEEKSGLKPVTYQVGPRNAESGKRAVIVDGWTRINLVDDKPAPGQQTSRLDRQPSSYRTLKLFDRVTSKIGEIAVQRAADDKRPADSYTLVEQPGSPPKWSITAPFKAEADLAAAFQLASELSGLGSQKYVYDPAIDEQFKITDWPSFLTGLGIAAPTGDGIFGLEKPAITATLKFTEPKGAEDIVIEIGKPRSATEYYARRKGTSGIFVVSDKAVKAIDRKAEDLVDRTLIQFASKPDIQTIRRSMGGIELEIGQNNSALWELTKPVSAKADQTMVEEIAQELGRLKALRIEAVTPKPLKEYGLEPPVATITIEALEKSKIVEKVLLVGNPVDPMNPKGDRFVKAQGSTMVAVLPGALAQKLVAEPKQFRDLSLGGFITADKIIVERGERKVTFQKGPAGWKVKEPLETDAEDADLRELHDSLAKLRAEEFVEDKPKDLAKYGLDKPTHWRIFNGDKEVLHLLVGEREKVGMEKKTEGIRSYAKLDKGDSVVLLDWRLSHELSAEYRKRDLWEPVQPQMVTEIAVKAPDEKNSFTLAKGPIGFIDPTMPTQRLSSTLVNDLLFALGLLKVDQYVVDKGATDLKPYGLDKPRTITITSEDGKKRVILIGNLFEGKRLYAKLPDPARTDVFLLSEADSKSLNRTREDYTLKPKEEKKDEPKKDEPKKVDPKKDEPKKDEPKKDEPKKSPEPKKEEPKKATEPKKEPEPK